MANLLVSVRLVLGFLEGFMSLNIYAKRFII